MDVSKIAKSTQEQAVASWIDYLNQLRIDEFLANLTQQDINLEGALAELQKLKDFVANPEHILGSMLTKHGEIAEQTQVRISNARNIIQGLKAEFTFENVGRTAPEDYLRSGTPIQAKFYVGETGKQTFEAVKKHLQTYPDFLRDGGEYEIPKDQYERISNLFNKPRSHLSRSEENLFKQIREWEAENNVSLENAIKPTVVDYADVQQGKISETITKEKQTLEETDKKQRDKHYEDGKPSVQEGLQATAVSAAIEGGMSFCLGVSEKLRSGKKLNEFTEEDWKEIGIESIQGAGKGAVRGASVYVLSNYTATPAAVASALVTASFGMAAQAQLLRQGNISQIEFIENSEVVCLDVTVSAIASIIGQVTIPIPVLGAVVGNAAGMFMYGIAKDILTTREQELISSYNENMQELSEQMDARYREYAVVLERELAHFESVVEFAFDLDINIAFAGSVALARYVGCSEESILQDKSAIDSYFLD